jgi:predicted porin
MKKRIFATTLLLSCGAASAQSTVQVFGVIDAGLARISGSGTGHATSLDSGGNSNSRLGFRGTEDLGGSLKAGFWLEGQINNDNGGGATQTTGFDFTRRATVSVIGSFGEVRLGRDFTPTYQNYNQFDIWGQRGIGVVETTGAARAGVGSYVRTSNSIAYFLPENLGGLYGTVQYGLGEQLSNQTAVTNASGISSSAINATTNKTNNFYGGRVGYASGPLDISAGYGVFQDAVRTVGTSFFAEDYKIANLGVAYDFGFIKPRLLYQMDKVAGRGTIAESNFRTLAIGATAPIGPAGLLRVQVARYDQANSADDFNKYSLGYIHNLSKRTLLYADVARLNNKGNGRIALNNLTASINSPVPVGGGSSTGYMVGIRHTF